MRKRTQAQLIAMAPALLNLTSAVPPYRGGGKADKPDQEFPFVVLRREYGFEPPDWFAWWYAFTMQDSCIAENEL